MKFSIKNSQDTLKLRDQGSYRVEEANPVGEETRVNKLTQRTIHCKHRIKIGRYYFRNIAVESNFVLLGFFCGRKRPG